MITCNGNFAKLRASYLFSEIAARVSSFESGNPDRSPIKLGIGDVTRPLTDAAVQGLHAAADEMARAETFRGYGPEQGYRFLRETIVRRDFAPRGAAIDPDEVFVSDGAKCDTGNFQELFTVDTVVAVPDPVYPVYVDTNVMAGRTGTWSDGRYDGLHYMAATPENGFVPPPPDQPVDLLYLCFPNNPTGATATAEQLQAYVDYARDAGALILFDAAYAEFIRDDSIPRSIFELPGAERCAVEFRSFSKTAGFTGLRCAYTVVPRAVAVADGSGGTVPLWDLWMRRQATKFNGASYPIQRAAAEMYGERGSAEIRELSDYYLANATIIRSAMEKLGFPCTGGINSPYVWIDGGRPSWDFFDDLLNRAGVVVTPGAGFGPAGEGFIRISAFNDRDRVEEAMDRISTSLA